VISADSHFTEPQDLWLRYIEPAWRDRAPHVEHRPETDVFVCDTGEMFPVGMIHGVRYKGGDVKLEGRYDDVPPSGWDPAARLAAMAQDGVSAEVLYPTIAMRFYTIEDVGLANACIRAYNTWAADFCRAEPQRFRGIGMVTLDDVDSACAEVRRCRQMGLSGIMIAVFPDGAEPYHAERYLPFWATAEELGMPVSLHTATERRVREQLSPAQFFLHYALVQPVLIGMIYAGLFDRFPRLQVVSVENDAGWAAHTIERMDYVDVTARFRNLHRDHLNKEAPSHYWHTNISCTFMRDSTAVAMRHAIGLDRLMWSSDFPHGDSTWPDSGQVIDSLMAGVPEDDQRKILQSNAARLYGFDLDAAALEPHHQAAAS
jgi:predicted TIM-barrel fold metal-dependent hydrolase